MNKVDNREASAFVAGAIVGFVCAGVIIGMELISDPTSKWAIASTGGFLCLLVGCFWRKSAI